MSAMSGRRRYRGLYTNGLGAFSNPAQLKIALDQFKNAASKFTPTIPPINGGDNILDLLKKNNELLTKILINSDAIYKINSITSSFTALRINLTTSAKRIYRAEDNDKILIFSRPGISGEGTDVCFIGNSNVNATTGYPIIAGNDFGPIKLERDTDVWGMSDGTATIHIMVF